MPRLRPTRPRPLVRPTKEELLDARDFVIRHSGLRKGQADWTRLTVEDEIELVAVRHEARSEGDGLQLANQAIRDRWERLLETLAGLPEGHFKQERKNAAVDAKFAQLAAKARALRPPKPTAERAFLAELYRHTAERKLHVDRLPILILVIGQLLAGEPSSPTAHIEGQGVDAILVVDRRHGLAAGSHDPSGSMASWRKSLGQLHRTHWLSVQEGPGPQVRIGLGSRTLRLLDLNKEAVS
jgi:hypothetical protein